MTGRVPAAGWISAILILISSFASPASTAVADQVQITELKAFLYADGGYFQPVTTGFSSNLDANGYGGLNWDFQAQSANPLQNAALIVFLDADLERATTTFFNEYGAFVNLNLPPGAAAGDIAATGWEIDEPGFLFGDLAQHLTTGVLDQLNNVPAGSPDDVALALRFPLGALPPNAPLKVRCLISASNIGGLSQTDVDAGVTFYFNGYIAKAQTQAPSITASTLARTQGGSATAESIAVVGDDLTSPGNLLVAIGAPAPGVSVTGLSNNNGVITASVGAACSAPVGNAVVALTVTDGDGFASSGNLNVAVTANPPPVLGSYSSTTVGLGFGTIVAPAASPVDDGGLASLKAAVSPANFTGAITVDPQTGVVSVSNAAPSGNFMVVVTATDNCGLTSTSSFSLTVEPQDCVSPNCPAAGPGLASAGSVLVYNLYTSSAVDPAVVNTRISLTNTDPRASAYVHLFFVDAGDCSVTDSYVCLTPNQTVSFLASDHDPGTTGYLLAVAVDRNGCPIRFNSLIGDASVKFSSGHTASLTAEAITCSVPPACDDNSLSAIIAFNGVNYGALPRVIALDGLASSIENNATMLVVNRIGGDLSIGAQPIGELTGLLFDDAEKGFSFALSGGCQLRGALSGSFPRTTPRLTQVIPAGRYGWMKLTSAPDVAVLGAALSFNPNASTQSNAFSQGRNLHRLRLTTAATISVPIFPPNC